LAAARLRDGTHGSKRKDSDANQVFANAWRSPSLQFDTFASIAMMRRTAKIWFRGRHRIHRCDTRIILASANLSIAAAFGLVSSRDRR
jgi:hypothetical protein